MNKGMYIPYLIQRHLHMSCLCFLLEIPLYTCPLLSGWFPASCSACQSHVDVFEKEDNVNLELKNRNT